MNIFNNTGRLTNPASALFTSIAPSGYFSVSFKAKAKFFQGNTDTVCTNQYQAIVVIQNNIENAAALASDETESREEDTPVDSIEPAQVISDVNNIRLTSITLLEREEEHVQMGMLDGIDSDHWSVAWSDLMMIMFVLFAVMLSVQLSESGLLQNLKPDNNNQTPQGEQQTLTVNRRDASLDALSVRALFAQSEQYVKESTLENVNIVLLADDTVKVSVVGPTLFDLGSAELKDEFKNFLNGLANILSQTRFEVNIVGHTDSYPISTPQYPSNWELSASRATAVARYLIKAGKMAPGRFTAIGKSMYQPVVSNNEFSNRFLNRRVEIFITRNEYNPSEVLGNEYF